MSIHDVYDGAQLMCRTLRMLDEAQLSIQVGDDMAEYVRIVEKERAFQPVGAPFDPDQALRNGCTPWLSSVPVSPRLKAWSLAANGSVKVVVARSIRCD